MPPNHTGWGGRRVPGPGKRLGRPRQQEEARRAVTVWVTQTDVDRLRALGRGNVSAGVRLALDAGPTDRLRGEDGG